MGVLVEGPEGFGEYSPFPGFKDASYERCFRSAGEASTNAFPVAVRTSVPVAATIPDSLEPADAARFIRDSGCSTVKVKCTSSDRRDDEMIEAVRVALGPAGKIRLDANAMWSVDQTVERIRALTKYGLEMVEQPVATLEDSAEVRRRVGVPIALDESISSLEDAIAAVRAQACDVLVLKVQYVGGISECLRIADSTSLPIVVSSALETSVGLSAGVAVAAALDSLPFACGLGTATLLKGDLTHKPLLPVAGQIEVRRVSADRDLLERFQVDASEVPMPQSLGSDRLLHPVRSGEGHDRHPR